MPPASPRRSPKTPASLSVWSVPSSSVPGPCVRWGCWAASAKTTATRSQPTGPASAGFVHSGGSNGRSDSAYLVAARVLHSRRRVLAVSGQWIARVVASTIIRRVVGIALLAVLAWAGIGRAEAAYAPQCTSEPVTCNKQAAYADCMAYVQDIVSSRLRVSEVLCRIPNAGNTFWEGRFKQDLFNDGSYGWYGAGVHPFLPCPGGTQWSDVSKTCFNRDACLDKSALKKGSISATAQSGCIDGCEFGPPPGEGAETLSFNGSAFVSLTKGWVPTGEACTGNPPSDNQECKQLGSGQTACVKPDGKICYSAASGVGSQFCWNPGETGEKTDGPDMQVTNAGDTPIPPKNVQLPSGDNLTPVGSPTNTTINNNGKTTTTTTNNYNTQHGTDAGTGPGQAEPGDGSGNGDGEGDGGTASGGGDCKSPPITTGDPVLGMVATQTWAARCATESGNAASVTGDVGDCKSPFSVEGDNANAHQLRAMRVSICGGKADNEGDANAFGSEVDAMEGEFESIFGEGDGNNDTGLSTTWFTAGSGSCPSLNFNLPSFAGGRAWTPPPQFCATIHWLSLLFQAIAMVWGIAIIRGR